MVEANPFRENYSSCEYPSNALADPQWDDDDEEWYYSNQMQTGTCVRHAIAKALYKEVKAGSPYDKKPKDLIDLLMTLR